MVPDNFPALFAAGSYGGLACGVLAAAAVAFYALRRQRGTPRQLALSTLVCLGASALMLAPLWWLDQRFSIAGPALDEREVAVWLALAAFGGWVVPLSALLTYVLLAAPQPLSLSLARLRAGGPVALTALDDLTRRMEPLGEGRAWGQLVPLRGPAAGKALPLTRAVVMLGREADNDVQLDDDAVSRHHAELRWNGGRPCLVDRASMNGTLRNTTQVHGLVALGTGDLLQLGAHKYRFERVEPGPAPAEETRKVASLNGAKGASAPNHSQPGERLVLVAVGGRDRGARWELWKLGATLATIGRDPDCAVHVADESVSRQHAQIVRQASGYYLADLASSNGTLLNGEPLAEPTRLRPGDVIRVGELELRCEAAVATGAAIYATVPVGGAEASAEAVNRAKPTRPNLPDEDGQAEA
jgi:pSer/pThr/pTyr-binding forkhead associated (FHA) protein